MSRSTDSSVDSLFPSVCQASKTTFAPPPSQGGGKEISSRKRIQIYKEREGKKGRNRKDEKERKGEERKRKREKRENKRKKERK